MKQCGILRARKRGRMDAPESDKECRQCLTPSRLPHTWDRISEPGLPVQRDDELVDELVRRNAPWTVEDYERVRQSVIAMVRTHMPIDREVAKCVVVCSNCHRKIHAGIITL